MRLQQYRFSFNESRASLIKINNLVKYTRGNQIKIFSPLCVFCLEQSKIILPLVANDFAAGEAADWNNHGVCLRIEERLTIRN